LLALPVELLQRITDNLSDETIPTFRLACKAIEASTFDTIAKIYFEDRYCCIYQKARWTLLRDIVFSRIGDRIRRVVFTTNALAPAQYEHLHLAPTKPEGDKAYDILFSQFDVGFALVGTRTQTTAWPCENTIQNCIIRIRNLSPMIHLEVEFDEECIYDAEKERTLAKANVLKAIAVSRMEVAAFKISSTDIVEVDKAMQTQGHKLSACIRSVQNLSLRESHLNTEDSRRLICRLLEVATELRMLWLQLYHSTDPLPGPTASKLLSVSNVSQLQILAISDVTIEGAGLMAVLSRCQATLLKVSMTCVCVLGDDSVWRNVFDTLALMPRLSEVRLQSLQQNIEDLVDSDYDPDRFILCLWTARQGPQNLTARLKRLLAAMPKVAN
jgi:hypothetical protein